MVAQINQVDVMNALQNLMGHRVSPGGTDDDWKRYIQRAYDYAWRYYRWGFSLTIADIPDTGILPEDFDYEGYRKFDGFDEISLEETMGTSSSGSAVVFDNASGRYLLSPAAATRVVYQYTPPTLTTDTSVPFPSAQVIALGATIYAKQAENPTRADVQQEWDMFHSELDRLVGRADNAKPHKPMSYHDKMGTFVGDTGA